MRSGVLTLAVGAMIAGAAGCSAPEKTAAAPAAPPAAGPSPVAQGPVQRVVLGDGRDRTASSSVQDWVTYADHVLVVTVTAESRVEPSKKEIERGEGMIGRNAQLTVDKVLWSAPDAPQAAPKALKMAVAGWVFDNHGNRAGDVKFAMGGASRLEKGHSYVKAVEWVDDPCSADPNVGTWEGLGSGDTIPYDAGVVGAGEFEGRVQSLDQARASFQKGESALRKQIAGASVSSLLTQLRTTKPRAEAVRDPRECDLTDR
ncbi:hypothetical protein AB0J83_38640 [Actinoplanes sp. NPDC049596]